MSKFYHTVWIKIKQNAAQEAVQKVLDNYTMLRAVPGVVDVKMGKNVTDRAKGFQLGLIVTFEKQSDLPIYIEHQIHKDFVKLHLDAVREETMAMDFEC